MNFLSLLGMYEKCSRVVYFIKDWFRCVKWKAWSYIYWKWIGKVMAIVC